MATRRAIRGVLGNFLGTYTSRYSDYNGYWLFGFLIDDLGDLRIDLLQTSAVESTNPLGVAIRSAVVKFADQLQKARLVGSQITEAWLIIQKLPGVVKGSINGVSCVGDNVNFSVEAVMDGGRKYERKQVVFVASHNATVELRSMRATEPRRNT